MIKNPRQAASTNRKIKELKSSLAEIKEKREEIDKQRFDLIIKSHNSLISELEDELSQFNSFLNGNFNVLKPKSLKDITDCLIAARICLKMSQRDLAGIIGIKEQQIQRYEATDYESCSFSRILDISDALGLKFNFDKILILECANKNKFNLPDDVTPSEVNQATELVKKNGFLMIN